MGETGSFEGFPSVARMDRSADLATSEKGAGKIDIMQKEIFDLPPKELLERVSLLRALRECAVSILPKVEAEGKVE